MKTNRRKRTTEITIDADEVVIAQQAHSLIFWWCSECGAQTPMLPLEDATRMAGVDSPTMDLWVKTRIVHVRESGGMGSLICWVSLARQL